MRGKTLIAASIFMTYAGTASAFFDVQVLAGKRWYEIKGADDEKHGLASQEIDVAAHIDPIPLIPIAFGASVAMGDIRKGDWSPTAKEIKTFEANIDIMAWLPMVPVVTPYARLKYPVVGSMTAKDVATVEDASGTVIGTEDSTSEYKIEGMHLNAGIKYSPLPVIKLLAEVGMGMQKASLEEVKVGGEKFDLTKDDKKKEDFGSQTFLIGVEIGL